MKRLSPFLRKAISLIPIGSSFLLLILIKSGITQVDPNIVAKTTPK